jgi:LPXTG-motif cell wall-anchored protein
MEGNFVTRSKKLRRPGALVAAGAASMVLVGLSAGAASAHTPNWQVDCSNVSVDLTAYNGGVTNHVTVTVDGQSTPLVDQDFGGSYHSGDKALPAHTSPLTVHLVVKAGDGDQYNVDQTKQSPVCEGQATTPPPSTDTQPAAAPTEAPTTAPAEAPTTAAPSSPAAAPSSAAPSSPAAVAAASSSPADTNLAETGSSSSTPIIAGAAAVVVVAGAGILWASRRRRAAQH